MAEKRGDGVVARLGHQLERIPGTPWSRFTPVNNHLFRLLDLAESGGALLPEMLDHRAHRRAGVPVKGLQERRTHLQRCAARVSIAQPQATPLAPAASVLPPSPPGEPRCEAALPV